MKLLSILTAAMITLGSPLALAETAHKSDILIENTWTRATPPAARSGGGFAVITNKGDHDDRLIAVTSPAADRVELHQMSMKDGVMIMREQENGIEVPAGQSVELAPGGLHIMFMKLKGPFEKGKFVPVTLTFEKAGDIPLDLKVEKIGAKGMSSSMDHSTVDHSDMDHSKMDHGDMKPSASSN